MKQTFDNVGFAQVQASTISLDATALQAMVQQIRSNFVRHPILFYKEEDGTAKAAEERSVKDIILGRDRQKAQSVQSASVYTHEAVSIQIVYR